MTTSYDAIFATMQFMETYRKILEEIEAECILEGTQAKGFFIQLWTPNPCQPGLFPTSVDDIPVMIVQMSSAQYQRIELL